MNNELVAMQTFLAVVEQQSFSAAARVLGVGQPSVSRRISDLEAHLETALLVRTTREVRPTEAGLRYYEAARTALAAVESARATARVEAAALTGTLRVGCGTLFADTWLAPRIPAWLEEHPELRLEFELSDAYVDLVSSRLDVSLRFGGPDTAELRGRPLATFARYVMASPEWVQRHGAPRTPDDLQRARALIFGQHGRREWVLHRGEQRATVRPDYIITATTGGFLETLARHHVGPILAPEWIARPRLASGDLVRLLPEWEGDEMTLWAVWPNHEFQSTAARRFLEWASEQVRQM